MSLYIVRCDDTAFVVKADDVRAAVTAWKRYVATRSGYDGTEEPESVAWLTSWPVITGDGQEG